MDLMNEIVSVIVPVYNAEKYLSRCLDSIVSQTYKNLQIIIVNDGSTDNSLKIIREYQKKFDNICVINKQNGGVAAARNDALKLVKGNYVMFVDSDDWIAIDTIQKCVDECILSNADIVCFGYYQIQDTGNYQIVECDMNGIKRMSKFEALDMLINEKIQSHLGDKFYKIQIAKNIVFPSGKTYEDSYIMHNLFLNASKVSHLNIPLYYYFQRTDSIVHTPSKSNLIDLVDSYIYRFVELEDILTKKQKNILLRTTKRKYILLRQYLERDKDVLIRENRILEIEQREGIKNDFATEVLFYVSRKSKIVIRFIYIMLKKNKTIYQFLKGRYRT